MRRTSLLLVMLLCACPSETPQGFVERPTQVRFEPGGDFWSVPMPSALRAQADGSFDFDRWPGPRGALLSMWLTTVDERLHDWGVNAGAFFTFTGALDPASLPTTAASLTEAGAVQLIDIDPASPEYGRRFPLDVTFAADAISYAPANLLSVLGVQGFPRRSSTLYAVVLLDTLTDTGGQPLGRSRTFHDALEGADGADGRALEALAPLRTFISDKKFPGERVVGATVFRTIDPGSILNRLATWVETQPPGELEQPWSLQEEYDDFVLYTARYRVPHVQSGAKPGKGRVVWTDDGAAPVPQGTQSVRLSLAMPRGATPASGVPLMLYFHGSGGEYREVMDRGPLPQTATRPEQGDAPKGSGPSSFLARRGIATMGFDFPLHGDRDTPPDTSGLKLYNLFGDIDSTIDNMSVAAMEAIYLTRTLTTLKLPVPAGGETQVDLTKLTAMGHSMGSTIGIPVATVDPRIKAYVFSGAGGLLVEVATETTYPTHLGSALQLFLDFKDGETLTRTHPLLHLFQSLWDYTDPVAKARHVAREPFPGHAPKPYFLPQAILDGYFHPAAQTAVGGALATTLVGESVDATLPRTLALDGRGAQASYPLRGNLNGVTAGTVHLNVPHELGHYVVFDMASIQSQVACFVESVGAVLVSPRGVDDACE